MFSNNLMSIILFFLKIVFIIYFIGLLFFILLLLVGCEKSVGGLIFRVSLTPLGSNFYYDNAFTYKVYWTVLKVPREIFGPHMVFLRLKMTP